MKKTICYILFDDTIKYGIDSTARGNDDFLISIITINPKEYTGSCMRRYDTIYCDAQFNQHQYEDFIKMFKQMIYEDGNLIFI